MPKREKKIVANNKKARHDYFIDDVYEVGIVLTGTEIKSVRAGKVSIKESYAKIQDGEIVLIGMNISPEFLPSLLGSREHSRLYYF